MSINNEIEEKFYRENELSSEYLLFIEYNPYESNIRITVDKKEVESNDILNPLDYTFEEWIEMLPLNLYKKYKDCREFIIGFHGVNSDKDTIIKVFNKSELKLKIIRFKHYPIKTFDDKLKNEKLKIINQMYHEVYCRREFGNIINLLDNFIKFLEGKEDKFNHSWIKELSNKLKYIIKSYYEREQSLINEKKQKLDNSIDFIKENVVNLKKQLSNIKEIKNEIYIYIEEFQNNFPVKAKDIKNKYIIELNNKKLDYLEKDPFWRKYNKKNNHTSQFSSEEFKSFLSSFQEKFIKEINSIFDDEINKWKIKLNDIICDFNSINNFDSIFGSSINFDSMKNFEDVKNKLEENFSNIITEEEKRIESQKEKIEKSFSDLFSKKEEEIKSKEKEMKSLEFKQHNINSTNIELLQKLEKQANSLLEI